jgi:hypothetical protein
MAEREEKRPETAGAEPEPETEEPETPAARDQPASASVSKARDRGQDSRATARLGEDPNGPSTRITSGRGIVERIAEHEAIIQHKKLPPKR